jgi:hypothetical protein
MCLREKGKQSTQKGRAKGHGSQKLQRETILMPHTLLLHMKVLHKNRTNTVLHTCMDESIPALKAFAPPRSLLDFFVSKRV